MEFVVLNSGYYICSEVQNIQMFISHAEQSHNLLPLHPCTVIQFCWSTTNHMTIHSYEYAAGRSNWTHKHYKTTNVTTFLCTLLNVWNVVQIYTLHIKFFVPVTIMKRDGIWTHLHAKWRLYWTHKIYLEIFNFNTHTKLYWNLWTLLLQILQMWYPGCGVFWNSFKSSIKVRPH